MTMGHHSSSASTTKVTPVYIRSTDHIWVPALQVQHNATTNEAIVLVSKYNNEHDMILQSIRPMEQRNTKKPSQTTTTKMTIPLKEYTNHVLPMQNTNANTGYLEEYKDMVDLPFLHEAAILYNLKLRHYQEKPYTRTGDIIIAVNPYQWYDTLYTEQKQRYYFHRLVYDNYNMHHKLDRQQQNENTTTYDDPRNTMEPHVYEVSALAYHGLLVQNDPNDYDPNLKINQSILVSGESGAGKTETVKICLHHIASIQQFWNHQHNSNSTSNDMLSTSDSIVRRVVQSNPLLEAFGNAQTRRNDNSSRFGKYIQLQFESTKSSKHSTMTAPTILVGSYCDVYLLEKNRVIHHDSSERTFHIFYQLLSSSNAIKCQYWDHLYNKTMDSYKYVGHTTLTTIEGISDSERFQQTIDALQLVGITDNRLTDLMRAVCIVMQLGNLEFMEQSHDADMSTVATMDELRALSDVMGIKSKELIVAFTERTFTSGSDTYKVPLTPDAAKEACDALAKEIYQTIFHWLVYTINEATSSKTANNNLRTIGLLDIFGFEVFPVNRFEQLCINYANEKLQQKFTEDIFTNVQIEYQSEGITLDDIYYDDNTDVLDLIEGRTGLLNLLNEECIRPKGNDFDYVQKSFQINKGSPALIVHKTDRMSFGIMHYAGQVMYDGQYFVSKNLDTLPTDLQLCVEKCTNPVINTKTYIGCVTNTPQSPKSKRNGTGRNTIQSNIVAPTVWTKYKNQLSDLMKNLRSTQSRYIRCIKPNSEKLPLIMEHKGSVEQLRCAGVIAGITISRSVFPNRLPNSVVLARYSSMLNGEPTSKMTKANSSGPKTAVEIREAECKILMDFVLKEKEGISKGKVVKAFVVGKTRTYFRSGVLEWLESNRMRNLDVHAITIQRMARSFLVRCKDRYMKLQKEQDLAAEEAKRIADQERKSQLSKMAIQRQIANLKKQKQMFERIAELKRLINDLDHEANISLKAANDRTLQNRVDIDDMKLKMDLESTESIKNYTVNAAEQEKRIAENAKLIAYLRKENLRARKEHEKYSSKLTRERNRHDMIESSYRDMSETVNIAEELTIQEVKSHETTVHDLKDMKSKATDTRRDVIDHQKEYMAEAKKRLEVQKIVAKLVLLVQETVANRNIVEEVVIIALSAESVSKAIMAALDTETSDVLF